MDNDVWAILKALDLSAKELLCADWLTKRCCSAAIGQETLNVNFSLKNIKMIKVTFKSFIWIYFLKVSIISYFKIEQKLEMRGVRGYTRQLGWGCVIYKVPLVGIADNRQLTFVLFLIRNQNGESTFQKFLVQILKYLFHLNFYFKYFWRKIF